MGNFNLVAYLQSTQTEISKLNAKVSSLDYINFNVPRSDTSGTLSSNTRTTNTSCRVITGAVVDVMAVVGWYNVQIDDAGFIPCELISEISNGVVGARRVGTLFPGALVYVVINSGLATGVILGTYQGPSTGLIYTPTTI